MSLAAELAARLRSQIDAGTLSPGDRLPPVRELAATEHVSAAVAGESYAMLAARGPRRLPRRARHLRGPRPRGRRPAGRARRQPPGAGAVGILDLQERLAGAQRAGAINLSAGLPVVDDRVAAAVSAELEAVVREEGASLFGYGPPRGDLGLRELVADAWRVRGLHADPEAILVTTSGQQAIDLAVRALVEPGDVVLCETPTYAGAVDALVASRARIVPIPVDANGLRVDAVEEAIRLERPRLLFANPTGNNATGTVLSDERRARLAALSAESGLVIIEDDTGAELIHDDGPVPAADRVVRSRGAGDPRQELRQDGAAGPAPRRDPAAAAPRPARAGREAGRRPLHVAAAGARPGRLPGPARGGPQPGAHAAAVPRPPRRLPALARAPARRPRHLARARAGFNLWLRLPDRVSEEEIFARGVERGVIVSPGHTYVPPGVPTSHLRLSFSTMTPAQADRGVAAARARPARRPRRRRPRPLVRERLSRYAGGVRRLPSFERLAVITWVALYVNFCSGALVRVTNSGLGCPDWPLCNGRPRRRSPATP